MVYGVRDVVLPVCYCTAHDDAHVHMPMLVDGQYGLPVDPNWDQLEEIRRIARDSRAARSPSGPESGEGQPA
jgi:hypothetical protein